MNKTVKSIMLVVGGGLVGFVIAMLLLRLTGLGGAATIV
jgi:hypothetical protein